MTGTERSGLRGRKRCVKALQMLLTVPNSSQIFFVTTRLTSFRSAESAVVLPNSRSGLYFDIEWPLGKISSKIMADVETSVVASGTVDIWSERDVKNSLISAATYYLGSRSFENPFLGLKKLFRSHDMQAVTRNLEQREH